MILIDMKFTVKLLEMFFKENSPFAILIFTNLFKKYTLMLLDNNQTKTKLCHYLSIIWKISNFQILRYEKNMF